MKKRRIKFAALVILTAMTSSCLIMSALTVALYRDLVDTITSRAVTIYQSDLAMAGDRINGALSRARNVSALILQDESMRRDIRLYDETEDILARVPIVQRFYEQLPIYMYDENVETISVLSRLGVWSVGASLMAGETMEGMARKLNLNLSDLRERAALVPVERDVHYGTTRVLRGGTLVYAAAMFEEDRPLALVIVALRSPALAKLLSGGEYALAQDGRVVWPPEAAARASGNGQIPEGTGVATVNERGARVLYQQLEEDGLSLLLYEEANYKKESLDMLLRMLCLALALSLTGGLLLSTSLVRRVVRPFYALIAQVRAYRNGAAPAGEAPEFGPVDMRRRVRLFILLAVGLPLAVYLATYAVGARRILYDEMVESYENSFYQGVESLSLLIGAKRDLLEAVGLEHAVQSALATGGPRARERIAQAVANHCRLRNMHEILQVYDARQNLLYSSSALDEENVFRHVLSDAVALDAAQTYLARDALNRPAFILVYDVRNLLGSGGQLDKPYENLGYVVSIVDEQQIESAYRALYNAGSAEIYIVDGDGLVVSSAHKSELGAPLKAPGEGQLRYAADTPGEPLRFVAFYRAQDVEQAIRAIMTTRICMVVIVYLLLVMLLDALIARMMRKTGRLKRMADAGDIIDASDFYEEDSGIAEIDELGRAFNGMKERIDQLLDDLIRVRMNETNMALMRREAELYALQSQIRPHFLCNVLESIHALIQVGDVERAGDSIRDLGELFRTSLSRADPIVTLAEELAYTRAYASIVARRTQPPIDFCWRIDPNALQRPVPKLILQPLVENAVKHGFPLRGQSGTVTILCEEEADALRIAVEDDGVGFDGYQIDESDPTHVGLSNVRRRIRLYYGERGDVLIESPPCGGARVVMRIPFQPDE